MFVAAIQLRVTGIKISRHKATIFLVILCSFRLAVISFGWFWVYKCSVFNLYYIFCAILLKSLVCKYLLDIVGLGDLEVLKKS